MNTLAIVRNTVDIFRIDWELDFLKDEERKAYYEAFSAFDWNNNGKISTGALIFAMRRAGRAEAGWCFVTDITGQVSTPRSLRFMTFSTGWRTAAGSSRSRSSAR